MALIVGQIKPFYGNVTTLNWIGARPSGDLERSLGFGPGRLAHGYCVLLLKQILKPEDFEFDGNTMNSGGRLGLPLERQDNDKARMRIHNKIMEERGPEGYRRLQEFALRDAKISGSDRIAKVLPLTAVQANYRPDLDFPMGGGGLQWNILRPGKMFLIALYVDESGVGHTLTESLDLKSGAPYENRARIMRYLTMA